VAGATLQVQHDHAFGGAEAFAAVAGFFVGDFSGAGGLFQQSGGTETGDGRAADSQDSTGE